MTYGPFPAGHKVTSAEWNEFVQAHEDEVTRATAAEGSLDTRADALETFRSATEARVPVGATPVRFEFGPSDVIRGTANIPPTLADPVNFASVAGAAAGQNVYVDLARLPVGCTLSNLYVFINCGGYTVLPTTMPKVTVYDYNIGTGSSSVAVGPISDASADLAHFNNLHIIYMSGFAIAAGHRYYMLIEFSSGGTGASAVNEIRHVYGLVRS